MKKITLLDGAVGTSLWNKAQQHGYEKVPVWRYNIEHPELVAELCREYIDAGSEIILTNTFGANRQSVKRSSDYTVAQVVSEGVRIAKEAVRGTGVRTALAIGPLSELLEPYGDLTEEEAADIFGEMIQAALSVGVDAIMIQTFMDLEMMKIAARLAKQTGLPVYCTMTFEKSGRTMMGNSIDDIIAGLAPLGIDAIGMNCSLGPDLALPIIRQFAEKTSLPLMFKPNAGLPISAAGAGEASPYTAETFAAEVAPALEFVSYIGGCCGSDPSYIRALKKLL